MPPPKDEPRSRYIALKAGSVLEDKYRLEEPIGDDATGREWRALHMRLQRPVAIKLPSTGGRDPERQAERFLREARLVAMVDHPSVARVSDFGSASEVQPYMVMDLLTGETLAERYEREPQLLVDEALSILERILAGLDVVHAIGIVHRDVNPANIFLAETPTGVAPKLTNFGVSRVSRREALEHNRPSVLTTRHGMVVGTPRYMSPEQARGLPDVDRRSDVFSMGVVMYEALTGRVPFEAEATGDLVIQIVTTAHTPASEFGASAAASSVIDRALAKRADDRYPTASEMRDAIRALS